MNRLLLSDTPWKKVEPPRPRPSQLELRAEAMRLYAARRARDGVLPVDVLGEAAWDMLLDLFIAAVDGRDVLASSLCRAGGTPPTTGQRYVAMLEKRGLVESRVAPGDATMIFHTLTDEGMDAVGEALALSLDSRPGDRRPGLEPPFFGAVSQAACR